MLSTPHRAAHGTEACPPDCTILSIALIAFLAMQIGVNPRSLEALILLGGFVRPIPIALSIPPQSGEGIRESGWRFGRGKRLAEVVEGHFQNISRHGCGIEISTIQNLLCSPL